MNLVIDASVLMKFFIPEILWEKAEKLKNRVAQGDLGLAAPDLIFPEAGKIDFLTLAGLHNKKLPHFIHGLDPPHPCPVEQGQFMNCRYDSTRQALSPKGRERRRPPSSTK